MTFTESSGPAAPKLPRNTAEKDAYRRLIVILDLATLEITRLGDSSSSSSSSKRPSSRGGSSRRGDDRGARYALLNSDDHQNILRKAGRDVSEMRPDITHQCLLTILDSPLNKAGRLQVFIRTQRGVLIEVNPLTRIPRTFTRFSGLMVQLLHKLGVKSVGSSEKLLNVIRNPVTDHLPIKHIKLGLSAEGPVVKLRDFVGTLPGDQSVVVYVGAMAHGEDKFEGVEERIAISQYPLSASVACGKLCDSFEDLWGII